MTPEIAKQIERLAELVEVGTLTKGRMIEVETVVCFTQKNEQGSVGYFQMCFDKLPPQMQAAFKGMKVGERTKNCKIMGVWDIWHAKDILK